MYREIYIQRWMNSSFHYDEFFSFVKLLCDNFSKHSMDQLAIRLTFRILLLNRYVSKDVRSKMNEFLIWRVLIIHSNFYTIILVNIPRIKFFILRINIHWKMNEFFVRHTRLVHLCDNFNKHSTIEQLNLHFTSKMTSA